MEKSATSLSTLSGVAKDSKGWEYEVGRTIGRYATLCEGMNGEQHVAVRVVADKNKNYEDEDGYFVEGVRHELGAWDGINREWKACGFDMTRVPKGWHHLGSCSLHACICFFWGIQFC